jgi:hypothetical protein
MKKEQVIEKEREERRSREKQKEIRRKKIKGNRK